jgi:hypothetical protein
MNTTSGRDDLAGDLKATLAARRELGPEMDDELVELMLARVDGYVQEQLRQRSAPARVSPAPPAAPASRASGAPIPLLVLLFVFLAASALGLVHVGTFAFAIGLLLFVSLAARGGRRGRRPRSP